MQLDDIRLTYVRTMDDVVAMLQWLGGQRDFLAVDVETTGLNAGRDFIRLCQFGDHQQGWALDWSLWKGVCKEAIEKYDRAMVCHNLLYDSKMLKKEGVVIPQRHAEDTMVMAFLKNPAGKMSLKQAAVKYVDPRAAVGQGLLKQAFANGGWGWDTVPVDHPAYWQYGVLDTVLTSLLASALYPEVNSKYHRAYETELGVIHCLREAELAGMRTDPEYRARASNKLRAEIDELVPQIQWYANQAGFDPMKPFKPSADRQVIDLLQALGARWDIRTEKGALSVDKDVLKMLTKRGFPVAEMIGQHRSKSKLLGSYMEKMDHLAVDDVVYANTRPLGARTGRMSVTDPPLQTLPRGRVVRDAFVAREGCAIVMADFKAMEMRALASLAQEQAMLAAFDRGEDLHDFVATALYGEDFTKPQRTICKNAGFAKVYGAGVDKFSATAEITPEEGAEFLGRYDAMFPGVGSFMGRVSVEVVRRAGGTKRGYGYVTLVDGRRIPVEADESYKGVNYLIQGSCAVSTKERIIALDNAGLGPMFRLAVHDELLFEVPIDLVREARHVIEQTMPDSFNFPGVTLEIDSDVVHRWGAHYAEDGFPKYVETEEPEWLQEVTA